MNLDKFVSDGVTGRCFSLPTAWRKEYTTFVLDNDIREVKMNNLQGAVGTDLNFLRTLPNLEGLIVWGFLVDDAELIESLHELRFFDIYWNRREIPDYSCFPKLEILRFPWRPKMERIFKCTNLKELRMSQYPGKTLEALSTLVNLETLVIKNSPTRSLHGIEELVRLHELGLHLLYKLESLNGVENLDQLRVLDVTTCKKINSLEPVRKLVHLKELVLADCGEIQSILPIKDLKDLEIIHLYESTKVLDGDMSPLEDMPHVKDVRFMNRKNYTLKYQQFPPFGENPEYPRKVE